MKTKILSLWVLLFINVLVFPTQYFSQMESEIDPKNMCFPTSMINSALSVGYSFDKNELDKYDNFIHSAIVTKYVNRYAPRYIKQMVNSGEYDQRELWQVEELAFNSYMGKRVCELKTNKLLEEINEELSLGRTLVISGEICNRNHCLSVIDIDEDGNYILIDPYGDPTIWYKDNSKYAKLSVTKNKFKNMFRMENGKYTYISFYTKNELESKSELNFAEPEKCVRRSDNLNVDIKTMLSIIECERLKCVEFTDEDIVNAYVSSSSLYECLAILCTGYKEYLLSYIPEEVELLLDKITSTINLIQYDLDKIKYIDKNMTFNLIIFYDPVMLSKKDSNLDNQTIISCIACLDNKRRLFKQEKCTRKSTFYTVENFKDFCIIY